MNQPSRWLKFQPDVNKPPSYPFSCTQCFLLQPFFGKWKRNIKSCIFAKLKFCGNWQIKKFNFVFFCLILLSLTKNSAKYQPKLFYKYYHTNNETPMAFLQKKSQIMICTFKMKYGFNCFERKHYSCWFKFRFLANTSVF